MYTGSALSVEKCSSNKPGENMPVPNESPFIERILACLTDGVITIDSSDLITTWNSATVNILRLDYLGMFLVIDDRTGLESRK